MLIKRNVFLLIITVAASVLSASQKMTFYQLNIFQLVDEQLAEIEKATGADRVQYGGVKGAVYAKQQNREKGGEYITVYFKGFFPLCVDRNTQKLSTYRVEKLKEQFKQVADLASSDLEAKHSIADEVVVVAYCIELSGDYFTRRELANFSLTLNNRSGKDSPKYPTPRTKTNWSNSLKIK